uniref:Uncharacterized protein n=1 Tax=Panagrolaimus sp. PS1159 TaxID=55785 RepID=A0AC35GFV9_9BILA
MERRKGFKNSMNFEKVSTNFQGNNNHHHQSSCFPILERKQRAPPPYDALYSVSNISSSSSAYSSGSSPLEPSDLTISTSADYPPEMLSVPLSCKVNYAPPRPIAKPQTIAAVSPNHISTVSIPESTELPPRATSAIHFENINYAPPRPIAKPQTIAAVSPNHVSTVSIPESTELLPRATSAIHFENSNNKKDNGQSRRYSTLRPSKPPPPPPHQNSTPLQNKSLSTISIIPSPKLVTKRSKRDERAAMLRAQSKITLMEN